MAEIITADELAETLRKHEEQVERLRAALDISPNDVGRIMHESWSRTKRAQGFHGPDEKCPRWVTCPTTGSNPVRCGKFHPELIPWDELPQGQKDLNLHSFDDVLAEMRRRAALVAVPEGDKS